MEREARRNDRELQKMIKARSEARKAPDQKRAAETAGPGPGCIGQGPGQESDTVTEEEQDVIDLATGGTDTDSGSGTGASAGSGKPAYSAEFAAGTETDRERAEEEREIRRNKREVQRAKALKDDEIRKAKIQKATADKAGPSGDPRNVQAEKEEMALASMCTLTGRSEEQCAQALAIQSEPGREFLEVYHRACHMLLEDGDPSKEGYANLVKGFQG